MSCCPCETCESCCECLSPLLDRELTGEEVRSVRHHLKGCPSCCRELALLCCADAEAVGTPVPAPSEELWERVCCEAGIASESDDTAPLSVEEILTLEEAARYLRLAPAELTESLDRVPHFRVGDHLRFRKTSLETWIEAQEQNASSFTAPRDFKTAVGGEVVDFMAARARLSRVGRL